MAKDRLSLHAVLVNVLGSSKVYFQPPATIKMDYPCIVYKLDAVDAIHADDFRYLNSKRYLITVIDADPDTILPDKLLKLRYCSFDSHFISNNLNHYIHSLYY